MQAEILECLHKFLGAPEVKRYMDCLLTYYVRYNII